MATLLAATVAATAPASAQTAAHRALIDRYCVTCHNEKRPAAGLALDSLTLSAVGSRAGVWEKVVRKLSARLMPPAGAPRPDPSALESLTSWLVAELDRSAAATPNPGRTEVFHRLNRAEYGNAVRDLLALDVDVSAMLPADDSSYGFDNMAGVLKLDQARMEQYLSAAVRISRAAIGSGRADVAVQEFKVPESLRQYEHIEGLPFGTRGGTLVRANLPQDGEYEVKVDLMCHEPGCDGSAGFADRHKLQVSVDGAVVRQFVLEPHVEVKASAGRGGVVEVGGAAAPAVRQDWRLRLPIKAGPREIAVAFLKLPDIHEVESLRQRFLKPYYNVAAASTPVDQAIYQPFVERVTVTGPFDPTGVAEVTPSRRRVFVCRPTRVGAERACASRILSTLARRAYRRPVGPSDLEPLLAFYDEGRREGGFETGVELALRRLLVSPQFLFRIESEPARVAANTDYRVGDLAVASRLSFFLWSSIPDDELLTAAIRGTLSDPAVLEHQVRRMLADRRASALVENFVGQWLQLRTLDTKRPFEPMFPNFDEGLRQAFRRETELFFESIVREDRSVLDLLTANYTFVNERLARHYGLSFVKGSHFRRVTLEDDNPRRGILGHGSVLLVTSHAVRTSPVLRGKWILENILGTPPPDPPANVPALKERAEGTTGTTTSVRERLAQHRANPACAGCHAMIDPPGFALEHFDAVGRWRDVDDAFNPVDASGVLPDGTKFNGQAEFREALLRDPGRFVETLTVKLLTYALGRGVEYYDMPAVRAIVRDAGRRDNRFTSIVIGIVKSLPFQYRRSATDSRQVDPAPGPGIAGVKEPQ